MDKKNVAKLLREQLNSMEYTTNNMDALIELGEEIVKELTFKENKKVRVLNFLLLKAYKSINTFKTLLDHKHYNDAYLITRNIVEILIRIEYLSKTDTFTSYFREKSIDQAKILNSLINSYPIKVVSQTPLWNIRRQIIHDCQSIYTDQLSGYFTNTPKLESMAEVVGMSVLYKNTYSALSKFTHSNISIENFYVYKSNNDILYDIGKTDDSIELKSIKNRIDETLYCFYLIIAKYCSVLNVFEKQIQEFNEEHFLFVSMDLSTGKTKSNVDIGMNLMEQLTGNEIVKEEVDLQHEVLFIEGDLESLRESWTKLENLVNQKERELEG